MEHLDLSLGLNKCIYNTFWIVKLWKLWTLSMDVKGKTYMKCCPR